MTRKVAGLPARTSAADLLKDIVKPEQPQPQWYDRAIEHRRRHEEFEANRQAEVEAKQKAAQDAALSTPDLIRQAVAYSQRLEVMSQPASTAGILNAAVTAHQRGTPLPLNGAGVLRAALNGGTGTINSQQS